MVRGRLLRTVALATLAAVLATTGAAASEPKPGALSAAQTANPFAAPDVFCKKHTPPAGARNASQPGVSPTSINITDMSVDAVALRRFGTDLQDFNVAYKAYVDAINECGGINGRKLNLKVARYNPSAPDLSGHTQALCLKAAEDQKAFIVVGTGTPKAQRCVSVNHRSIFVGGSGVLSADFADAKGRIATITPAGDTLAQVFVDDAVAQQFFRDKKVGVLGAATTPTAADEQRDQYVTPLAAKGVDVGAFEVLPCTGSVCTQGIGSAVSRLRQKGVEVIVLTHYVTLATLGSIWRELNDTRFRVPVYNPFTDALNSDATLGGLVRGAGADGSRFAQSVGWYTTKFYDVQNAWRIGGAKETPFARMCTAVLAASGKDRRYLYNEQDLSSGRWQGTVGICQTMRGIAQAIWSLGNNVTTDRLAAALGTLKATDRPDTSVPFRTDLFFSGRDVTPNLAMTAKLAFPCPLPRLTANEACFLPVDRPARVRKVGS